MAYLLTHPTFDQEAQLSGIGDAAYRGLMGSMFYTIDHHTNWCVPMRMVPRLFSEDNYHAAYFELVETGWWVYSDGLVQIAVRGPRGRTSLMRRCQTDRPPIPKALRQFVYSRDGYRCVACLGNDDLTLDHIWPWSRGGTDEPSNLRTLCRSCNSRKGARV